MAVFRPRWMSQAGAAKLQSLLADAKSGHATLQTQVDAAKAESASFRPVDRMPRLMPPTCRRNWTWQKRNRKLQPKRRSSQFAVLSGRESVGFHPTGVGLLHHPLEVR